MNPQFLTELAVQEMRDEGLWELLSELKYYSGVLGKLIVVPVGFITDFASVPRVPIIYSLFGDRAHHESVVHDYLYFTAMTDRETSDKVFLEAMKARGKSGYVCYGMYWGVRLGGWSAWDAHRKLGDPTPNNKSIISKFT